LQLNQLPFAVGSPIRRAEEKQYRSTLALQIFQCLLASKLIPKSNGRSLLSGGKPIDKQLVTKVNRI
jgi:hypothetical protein